MKIIRHLIPILAICAGVFASCDDVDPDVLVIDLGDSPIKKAESLKENSYSIQKTGEEAKVFPLPQQYSSWYVAPSYMSSSQEAIHVELMDEDEQDMTQGWLNAEIPPAIVNKLTTINKEFCEKYPWATAKLGTMRLGDMLDAHAGQGGNVKLDGSCQIYLKEKSGTKAYSGQYQFLFVIVFENREWDPENEVYLPGGDEYTICGNAIVEELVADLSYFSLNYSSNWAAPGQSITLTASWTPGASFDWSKVKLDSQTCGGLSGDWFSWDASTQKLTAKKSADNDQVTLSFSYAGTDMKEQITIFNGPGYTSFSIAPRDGSSEFLLAENDPQGWSSNDYVYIAVRSFKPDNSYSFNYHSIEIDPASDYYDKLYYNDYGPYVQFNHNIPEGDYNIIFRNKADHNAKCTVPVKIVKHKVTSFQITYPHSNGSYEPWTSGGENGICNYPMGLSLGVITVPDDAYWNWAHVELASNEGAFSFSGMGGRDDHPKLMLNTSSGSTIHGVQVIFRLKWDHNKKSEIYVNHN